MDWLRHKLWAPVEHLYCGSKCCLWEVNSMQATSLCMIILFVGTLGHRIQSLFLQLCVMLSTPTRTLSLGPTSGPENLRKHLFPYEPSCSLSNQQANPEQFGSLRNSGAKMATGASCAHWGSCRGLLGIVCYLTLCNATAAPMDLLSWFCTCIWGGRVEETCVQLPGLRRRLECGSKGCSHPCPLQSRSSPPPLPLLHGRHVTML